MRIVSVNIEGSRHLERVRTLIEETDPECLCIQEFYERDAWITHRYPYHRFVPMSIMAQDDHPLEPKGVLIASKQPAEMNAHQYAGPETLTRYERYDGLTVQRWLLTARFDDLLVATTHMMVTADARVESFQYDDVESIIALLENEAKVVFCGDLNTPRGGPIFSRFCESFKDTIPKEAKTTLDQDLHRAAPVYLVVDGAFVRGIRVDTQLRFGVSDHTALIIDTLE